MLTYHNLLQASDPSTATLAGLLGVVLGPVTGEVGIDCSPISVIAIASGNACSAQAVCCTNNSYVSDLTICSVHERSIIITHHLCRAPSFPPAASPSSFEHVVVVESRLSKESLF